MTGSWRGRAKWQPFTARSTVDAVTVMDRVPGAASGIF